MTLFYKIRFIVIIKLFIISFTLFANNEVSKPWTNPSVSKNIIDSVLFLPIAHESVKKIPIKESEEELVDLRQINDSRIKPLTLIDQRYRNTYDDYSKIRKSIYLKLVKMLEILPKNVGVAYFEGYRPINKQKEYFDKKFKEVLMQIKDKELAYEETSKFVSPFINNCPPHVSGAAIDMTLFQIENGRAQLLDMGDFDELLGPNDHQHTFSEKTTALQRKNRLLLLGVTSKVGLVNYGYEWWHFSYGDRAWAFVKGEKNAIYDLAAQKEDPILKIEKKAYLESFK